MQRYFGKNYEWIDEEHEIGQTRAYRLFKSGQISVGRKVLTVTPDQIEFWLKNQFIKEI